MRRQECCAGKTLNTLIKDWCTKKWIPTDHAKQFVPKGIDPCEFAKEFCTKGMNVTDSYTSGKNSDLEKTIKNLNRSNSPKWPSQSTDCFNTLTSYLSKDSEGENLRELSILMSQRTYYGDKRNLTAGTIIRKVEGDKRYLLCLQPACDSVRLTNESTFIFYILQKANKKATHVVKEGKKFIDLIYKPKIENCVTLKFNPSKGSVEAKDLTFSDRPSGQLYQWIAQLKPNLDKPEPKIFSDSLVKITRKSEIVNSNIKWA